MRAIFTADLHGNISQYEKLFSKAAGYDAVIIGGDIAPHGSIQEQKGFLKNKLIPLIKRHQPKKLLMMPGNDDWMSCLDVLNEYDGRLFDAVHMKEIKVSDCHVIGYSFIPITIFGIKDWEKWDSEGWQRYGIRLDGYKSKGNSIVPFSFSEDKSDSIENDLQKIRIKKNTVCVFHCPPHNTQLDMLYSKKHVGSEAMRRFIGQKQPLLTLHGHIHETVDVSGEFTERIGKTVCASAGNHNQNPELAVIVFDTNDLGNIKRLSI